MSYITHLQVLLCQAKRPLKSDVVPCISAENNTVAIRNFLVLSSVEFSGYRRIGVQPCGTTQTIELKLSNILQLKRCIDFLPDVTIQLICFMCFSFFAFKSS